ncbi:MAG: glycerol-3-phosphate 1-O-acyltransferase PlsY [Ardenticatenaceae bacterium]|nr:glycerol-3-phosphate 1-O-acyltransferase PlsY [Ardenticatenaceae bacterium]
MDRITFAPIVAILLGYLIGSIPVGLVVGRIRGVDPRMVGSGRTGGTNVYRAAGPAAGIITAVLDTLKGAVAVALVRILFPGVPLAAALAALAAVAGHNWSLFLRFRGGAGTMTNLGNLLILFWPIFIIAGLLGLATLYFSRMSSLASLVVAWGAAMLFILFALLGSAPPAFIVYGIGQALLITWSLRPNIRRILAGTERRVGEHGAGH